MKILFIWNNIFKAFDNQGSGAKSHNHFLIDAFQKLGHQVRFLAPAGNDGFAEQNLDTKRTFYRSLKTKLPLIVTDWLRDFYSIVHDVNFDKTIAAFIKEFQPDLIYERFTDYHSSGIVAAKKANLPYLVEIHAPLDSKQFYQRLNFADRNRRRLMKVASEANGIIVVSSFMKSYLKAMTITTDKITVIPNAVDPDLFSSQGQRDIIRKKLSVSDKVVIGFVGTMKPYHGLDLLPEVCEILKKNYSDFCFLLVGRFKDQADQVKYLNHLDSRGLKDYFIFTGGLPVGQVPPYVEAMDICLMPDSNNFGSPIKLFEYGAMAKPVVMPRYQPIQDVLTDGVNGLLFQPKSVTNIADRLLQLMNSETLRKQIGENLYHDVIANHTWQKNARIIIDMAVQSNRLTVNVH